MLEGHCMGFRLNLLWFAEFSIDSEMFWYDSPSILKGLCRDAPLTLERFGMDFDWFWNVFDRILHSFWKDLWWIPNYFLSWGFWSDSSLILQCFWSGSPLILNWLRMDPHWLWPDWGWIASWFCKANYMKHARRMLYKSIRIDPYWVLFEFQLEAEVNDIWMSTQRGLNDNSTMIQSTFASIRIQWTLHENAGGNAVLDESKWF